MSRRQPSRILHDSSAPKRKLSNGRSGWLNRLLNRASDAGIAACRKYGLEKLETRTLFNTFTSFGTGVPGTGTTGDFIYWSGQNQVCELSYYDVNFEAVALSVNPMTGAEKLGNLVMATAPTEPPVGTDLYKVYVTESASDSYITVTTLNSLAAATPTPFGGTVPAFVITTTAGAQGMATIPAGTGGVFLGALNAVTKPGPVPIIEEPMMAAIGLQPVPANGELTPGIEVIPVNAATNEPNNFGEFLVGGTVTGSVEFPGNLSEFYAGAVLTGDLEGDTLPPEATTTVDGVMEQTTGPTSARIEPQNFYVGGDLREFLTSGPVGTDGAGAAGNPTYITNFDLSVNGKIGEVHIGNAEHGAAGASFAGTIEAGNSPLISGQTAYATPATTNVTGIYTDELETENLSETPADAVIAGTTDPVTGFPTAGIDLLNTTMADAQILYSVPVVNALSGLPELDSAGNVIYHASVDGSMPVTSDTADFYAAPFLAGVTFDVTINSGTVEVIDPAGRVIASNSRSGTGPLQITTTSPGLYTFEVIGAGTYNLTVTNIGNEAIGGIVINQNFNDVGIDSGIIAGNGDLGLIEVDGTYTSTTTGPTPATVGTTLPTTTTPPLSAPTSILVANGNLRGLIAGAIGIQGAGPVLSDGPYLSVANGSVGLVQASTGVLNLETQFDPNYLNLPTPVYKTDDAYATAIGGSIQVISAATIFQGDVATNAGIGTIAAGNMATATPSYIDVNADNKGTDGIIDLIDVTGDLGTLAAGGPGIVTNTGGDVRYMVVGGTVYRDQFFGGGEDDPVTYNPGQPVQFTDQAGNVLTITPVGDTTTTVTMNTTTGAINPATNTSAPSMTTTTTVVAGPQVTILAYGVRDKGGQIPISINCASGALAGTNNSTGASLVISAAGTGGPNSQVNIGSISIAGTGSAVVATGALDQFGNAEVAQTLPINNASTGTTTTVATTANADGSTTTTTTTISGGGMSTYLSLDLTGSTPINALNVASSGAATLIENTTPGEIANLTSAGIGQILVHGNLGYTTPVATPAAVLPTPVITDGNTYPFVQQHTGVVITGDAVSIDAYGGIGNVVVTGTLESLIPNYQISTQQKNAQPVPGQFDGIVGPIYGDILLNIDIGQGILPTGSGSVGFSGIFATGTIGMVTNAGNPGADIRGTVVSLDGAGTGVGIGGISLKNGSIIAANILNLANADFTGTTDLNFAPTLALFNASPFANPYNYGIGSITVSGLGGILGSEIISGDVGPILVTNGGFGVLDTLVHSAGLGRVAGITASGYGVRDCDIVQTGYLGPIVATGSGQLLSVLTYPIDLRQSDVSGALDPYFGVTPGPATDLDAALGVSALAPNVPNETDTGVIQDCILDGGETFAGLVAQKVRTAEPLVTYGNPAPTPTVLNIPQVGIQFPMSINFPAAVGTIRVYQETDGLQITTGALAGLALSSNVNRVGISVSGAIKAVFIKGNFGQYVTDPETGTMVPDSYLSAGGPSGTIGLLKVLGNLNANVYATGQIYNAIITGDVEGAIVASGSTNGKALGSLRVFGGIRDGSLILNGNVGSIIVNQSLGTSTGSLTISGNAGLIEVGANRAIHGSQMALALNVTGTLNSLLVYGSITGTVHTSVDLKHLTVINDGTTPNAITGNINVDGRFGSASIVNGNITSNIVVGSNIGSFTITRGNLNAGALLESQLGSIGSFRTLGGLAYGVYGSILAAESNNESIDISGNLGDGIHAAVITANSGKTFRVRGNISADASMAVTTYLNLLRVDGSIKTGATVSAHPLKNLVVEGVNDGMITSV